MAKSLLIKPALINFIMTNANKS